MFSFKIPLDAIKNVIFIPSCYQALRHLLWLRKQILLIFLPPNLPGNDKTQYYRDKSPAYKVVVLIDLPTVTVTAVRCQIYSY